MESVKDSLLNKEARWKEKGKSSSRVLVHEKQERREKPKRRGRSQIKNSHCFRGISKFIKYIKCYHCNKVGHVRKECRIWKNEHNDVKKENKETNVTAAEGDIMIVIDDGYVSLATQDSNWVIDFVPHSMLLLIVTFSLPIELVILVMLEWETVVYPILWVLDMFG